MSSSSDVADAIREYLAEQGLVPGDRLPPERVLAETLGVSRPALREASRRLVDVGLLRSRQGSGTYVADVDLSELFAVRRRLEPLAAEQAALQADDTARAELERLLVELRGAIEDAPRFAELDLRLHGRVARASGNRLLVRMLDDLDVLQRVSRSRTAVRRETRWEALDDLTRVVRAIAAGDADAAGAAMEAHLATLGRIMRADQAGPRSDGR